MKTNKLKKIGTEWVGHGKHRIYFSYHTDFRENILENLGIHFIFYNTGNISSCIIDSNCVSNNSGKNYLHALESLYYDVDKKKFITSDGNPFESNIIIELIKKFAK